MLTTAKTITSKTIDKHAVAKANKTQKVKAEQSKVGDRNKVVTEIMENYAQ